MKLRLFTTIVCLLSIATGSRALMVTGTYPPANSELFLPPQALVITFDETPDAVFPDYFSIHGEQAEYGVASVSIQDNEVILRTVHYWLTGDHVTVTVKNPLVTIPYVFQFHIRVPIGVTDRSWLQAGVIPGSSPRAIYAADFDGDGPVDVAIVTDDSIGVARNIGLAPEFLFDPATVAWSFAETGGDEPRVLRAGDLNSDGKPDLVSLNSGQNLLRIYLNNSDSGFVDFASAEITQLLVTNPADLQIADFDGDGWPDIALIGQSPGEDSLIVLRNTGSGPPISFEHVHMAVGNGPSRLAIADLDRDGTLDIAVSCVASQTVELFYNNITTPTSFDRTILPELPGGPDGVLLVNTLSSAGQYLPDLAVWSVGEHSMRGRGRLDEPPYFVRIENLGERNFSTNHIDFSGWNPNHSVVDVTCADFDSNTAIGDGDRDWLITTMAGGDTGLIWLQESGSLISPPPCQITRPRTTTAADLDLDGDMDMVAIDLVPGAERVVYYLNAGRAPGINETVEFGVVPIDGFGRTMQFAFRNRHVYPVVIDSMTFTNPVGVYTLLSPGPEIFPLIVPVDSIVGIVAQFLPRDSVDYTAMVEFHGRGDAARGVIPAFALHGTGGRSLLGLLDNPAGSNRDTVWLGTVEPGGSIGGVFWLRNHGNFVLDTRCIPTPHSLFVIDCPSDSIASYARGVTHGVVFTAPPGDEDRYYVDSLLVEDFRFHFADGTLYPRNLLIADTATLYFKARAFRNSLPELICPGPVQEGDTNALVVELFDPDAPGEMLLCRYLGKSGSNALQILFADTATAARRTFTISYTVGGNVLPGETATLYFELRDHELAQFVLDSCVIQILPVNDPPRIIFPANPLIVTERTDLSTILLAYSYDEEGDTLWGNSQWLPQGRIPPAFARIQWQNDRLEVHLPWTPDCDAQGTYLLQLRMSENVAPFLFDQQVLTIEVRDSLPDIQVSNVWTQPPSVTRGDSIRLYYEIHEALGTCPFDLSFRVCVRLQRPGQPDSTLRCKSYSRLNEGATLRDSLNLITLSACGSATFAVAIDQIPGGSDSNPNNNTGSAEVTVLCPELVAVSVSAPSGRKNQLFPAVVRFAERSGVDCLSPLRAVLFDGTTTLWDSTYSPLSRYDEITDTVWTETNVLGSHSLCLQLYPGPYDDSDPLNNRVCTSLEIVGDPFRVFPQPFTPNNDGYNDSLHFDFGDERYASPLIRVFDMAGRVMVELDEVIGKTILWDGRDKNNSDCIPGPYFYTLTDGSQGVASGLVYIAR